MEKDKIKQSEILTLISQDIERLIYELHEFLRECGVEPRGFTLTTLLREVKNIKTMKVGKTYTGFNTDENGYVIDSFELDEFIEGTVPEDIHGGYYKVTPRGKLEIDYERKRQLEEV